MRRRNNWKWLTSPINLSARICLPGMVMICHPFSIHWNPSWMIPCLYLCRAFQTMAFSLCCCFLKITWLGLETELIRTTTLLKCKGGTGWQQHFQEMFGYFTAFSIFKYNGLGQLMKDLEILKKTMDLWFSGSNNFLLSGADLDVRKMIDTYLEKIHQSIDWQNMVFHWCWLEESKLTWAKS